MAIAALSPITPPDISVIPAVIAGIFPFMILAMIGLVIIWFFLDWKWMLVPLVTLLLFWNPISKFWTFNSNTNDTTETIKLGTFNLYGLKKIKQSRDSALLLQLKSSLKTPQLDVICFQESNGFSNKLLEQLLDYDYKYQYLNSGVKIVSQYNIEDKGSFDFNSTVNSCIWADIRIKDNRVRVYCAHLQSNKVSSSASALMESGNLAEKNTWRGMHNIVGRYKTASKIRQEQSNRIKTHAMQSESPVIICGDLNDHPLSYPVAQFAENWNDSFVQKGFGWGTTYGGSIPMLRIDYIMVDSNFRVINHHIEPNPYSDHHFVYAGIEVK
ncbi:MAG: endonuclease/exonuclease/phosphatase family protein [Saprospiraceae bacterium]|nr:endonuclease/exonuclease/phosphatase family protein [Saprospiraceae bacterium]